MYSYGSCGNFLPHIAHGAHRYSDSGFEGGKKEAYADLDGRRSMAGTILIYI